MFQHLFRDATFRNGRVHSSCSVLISLGYFIGLRKSNLEPSQAVRFLGCICDSERQAFILPEDKGVKFSALRESILKNKTVSLKNLQKFAGKTTSIALLVPAAKLYTNAVFQSISKACKSNQTKIRISESLRQEIEHWRFLDTWKDSLPWRTEFHHQIKLSSDASHFGWGACLLHGNQPTLETRGYWDIAERSLPITAKETLALLYALQNLGEHFHNARVDVLVDSKVLVASWGKQVRLLLPLHVALKGSNTPIS